MIRLAVFSPPLTTGGTQRHLQMVLPRLDPGRFHVSLHPLRGGGEVEAEIRACGIPVAPLDLGGHLRNAAAVVRAARMLRGAGVQIVHGYGWRPAFFATLVGPLARIPLVLASKRSLTGADSRALRAWRIIGRRVDTILVNAEALREEGESLGIRARWTLIPNGIDVERFRNPPAASDARAALGLDPHRPVVGTVGRLEARKGHDDFLAAAHAMLERANGLRPQILIVGDGPWRERLARQASELGLAESVRFTGSLADVRGSLAAMDVFVLPSRAEGMSNALLEAMAAGRPVVATAVGGTREVFDGDRTGVLVPPGDARALAAEVLRLLTDREEAARLAAAGQRWIAEKFSMSASIGRLEALYEDRLSKAIGIGH
jgi:glycosyltransferase involved in cell wall biosynthesis